METLLNLINRFLQQCMYWMGVILDFVIDNPILALFVLAMPVVSYIVDLIRRLLYR